MAFQGNHKGISTYFGLDKDKWLNDMLNSLLWTGELVSEARSENGYGKWFLLCQDMENRGHIITTSPVISKIILTMGGLVVRLLFVPPVHCNTLIHLSVLTASL